MVWVKDFSNDVIIVGNTKYRIFFIAGDLEARVTAGLLLARKPKRVAYVRAISTRLRLAGLESSVYGESSVGEGCEYDGDNNNTEEIHDQETERKTEKESKWWNYWEFGMAEKKSLGSGYKICLFLIWLEVEKEDKYE